MDERRRRWAAVGVAGLLLVAAGCGASGPSGSDEGASTSATSEPTTSTAEPTTTTAAPTTTAPPAELAPAGEPSDVVTGLDAPWSVVFVGDTPLVSERDSGRILEVLAGGGTRTVGTVGGIAHGGEGGLLGLAVRDGQLYAYSTGAGGNRIQRIALTGGPGSYGLGEAVTILDGLPRAGIHNGGRIAFGPDGMLYAGVGDAGQTSRSQDLGSLGGKILRMTPDGGVPADNPFPGSLVWSYGHRNVQGLAWTADGTMFASEFGQNTWDELNVITPGANYGWPVVEGIAGAPDFVDPVQQWATSAASPSGLVAAGGTLFLANLRGQVLRSIPVADPSTSTELYRGTYGRLRAVAVAPDGSLWVVTNNTDGRGSPRSGDDRILRIPLA